jgi:uncharacterized protein
MHSVTVATPCPNPAAGVDVDRVAAPKDAGCPFPPTLRASWPGAFLVSGTKSRRSAVFEGHSQEEVEQILKRNPEFRKLYHHHRELNTKVMDAELGVLPIDDITLMQMKKEKLLAKDRLQRMVQSRELMH